VPTPAIEEHGRPRLQETVLPSVTTVLDHNKFLDKWFHLSPRAITNGGILAASAGEERHGMEETGAAKEFGLVPTVVLLERRYGVPCTIHTDSYSHGNRRNNDDLRSSRGSILNVDARLG
jgi:hypothetical protein